MKLDIQRDLPAGARRVYVCLELPVPPADWDLKKQYWVSRIAWQRVSTVEFTVTEKINGLVLDRLRTYGDFEGVREDLGPLPCHMRDQMNDDKQIISSFGILDFGMGHGGSRTLEIKGDLIPANKLHHTVSQNSKIVENEKDLKLTMYLSIADHDENGKLYTECIQIL